MCPPKTERYRFRLYVVFGLFQEDPCTNPLEKRGIFLCGKRGDDVVVGKNVELCERMIFLQKLPLVRNHVRFLRPTGIDVLQHQSRSDFLILPRNGRAMKKITMQRIFDFSKKYLKNQSSSFLFCKANAIQYPLKRQIAQQLRCTCALQPGCFKTQTRNFLERFLISNEQVHAASAADCHLM